MYDSCTNFFQDEASALPINFYTLSTAHKQEHINMCSDFHIILFVLSGHGIVKSMGKEYELKRGTGFFNAQKTPVLYYGSDDFVTAYITARNPFFDVLLDYCNHDKFIYFDSVNIEKFILKIKQIEKEYNTFRRYDVLSSLTYSLFVDFLNQNLKSNDDAMSKIAQYIENNFHKKLSLNDLAKVGHISKSTLTHNFKKKFNVTVLEYITLVRLEQANIFLLTMPDMTVKDIAFSVGFDTVDYFCDLYKSKYGLSPSQKRKQNNI